MHEEPVTSYWSLWVDKIITDKGNPDGRNVQIGLAAVIG
jgi:hypothetical protein